MSSFPTYIYLHGFASGPSSTKAEYFVSRLQELSLQVYCPDLNGSGFADLTLTSQLEVVDGVLRKLDAGSPVVMIGSSMGGLLSTLQSQRNPRVRGLVLLAPGFGLPRRWQEMLGQDGLERWREDRTVDVFHHAMNKETPLKYSFIEDAQLYQTDELRVSVPTLVFHGQQDETVPVEESVKFAQLNQSLVELHLLDADHSLVEPLDYMWSLTHPFLIKHGLAPARRLTQAV